MPERKPPLKNAKCPECGKMFARSGLRIHRATEHGVTLAQQKEKPPEIVADADAQLAAGTDAGHADAERERVPPRGRGRHPEPAGDRGSAEADGGEWNPWDIFG